MKHKIEQLLYENGASLVGFAKIDELYQNKTFNKATNEEALTETINIPHYPYGISIILALPKDVIRNISNHPTMDYYDAYHSVSRKLDDLAVMCAEYIEEQGYHAYPQTVLATKGDSSFRTEMPHKTVAVHAGLGWIGKSALFLTDKYGSAVRLTSVLTDAPLEFHNQIMQSKCGGCMLCSNACPGRAISGKVWSPELDRDEYFDALACRKAAREIAAKTIGKQITLCGKCIEICPYTRVYTLDHSYDGDWDYSI